MEWQLRRVVLRGLQFPLLLREFLLALGLDRGADAPMLVGNLKISISSLSFAIVKELPFFARFLRFLFGFSPRPPKFGQNFSRKAD